MRVHHLNCGTLCPFGGRLFDGLSPILGSARLVCHCLLLETDAGLVLVDTGLGTRDVAATYPRLSHFFTALLRPRLDLAETARVQIERLGFSPADVRHIVLTHLDFDHAGGLDDFPGRAVHLWRRARGALAQNGLDREQRYPPAAVERRGAGGLRAGRGERWFGFEAVRDLRACRRHAARAAGRHTLGHGEWR